MTPNSYSLHVCAWLVALASSAMAGCLCPPCPVAGAVAGPGAAAAPGSGANEPAAPVASGTRTVIWDGDEAGTGAQSWEGCDQKPNCKVKVGVEPGVGMKGSIGLKFHGEGGGWIGMGWNIYGWYPENAGFDLTPYSHLTFQIRVEGKTPGAPADPGAPAVLLGCSANKFDSADAPIEKYMKGYGDGKWHKVAIPIPALVKGKGAKFDLASFWEFRISTWSGSQREFNIYVDDIAAEKR
ncbi:MAG: hypothetical protein JXP73_18920 [Deltaproteobacteria bacterium]|jgi:hypothetical protein|nr:hypothetical protein [Deltaproteobacteria bacterium]